MNSRRLSALLAIPLFSVVLLAGCGGNDGNGNDGDGAGAGSVADRTYSGTPDSAEMPPDAGIDGEPVATWVDAGETFAITTWGSSSCPAVATSIETTDAGGVDLEFDSTGDDGPCTADMAATTHEFTVPVGAQTSPLDITVSWVGGDGATELTLE